MHYRIVNSKGQYLTKDGAWTSKCYDAKNFYSKEEAKSAKTQYGGSKIWTYVAR